MYKSTWSRVISTPEISALHQSTSRKDIEEKPPCESIVNPPLLIRDVYCYNGFNRNRDKQDERRNAVADDDGFVGRLRSLRHDVSDDDLEDGEAEDECETSRNAFAALEGYQERRDRERVHENQRTHDVAEIEVWQTNKRDGDFEEREGVVVPRTHCDDSIQGDIVQSPLRTHHPVRCGNVSRCELDGCLITDADVTQLWVERKVF